MQSAPLDLRVPPTVPKDRLCLPGAFGWALLRDEDAAQRQWTDPLKSALGDFLRSSGVRIERR